MELWIRSQDKMNLVRIKQINVNYRDNRQIIANYMPEEYENSGEYYELLPFRKLIFKENFCGKYVGGRLAEVFWGSFQKH